MNLKLIMKSYFNPYPHDDAFAEDPQTSYPFLVYMYDVNPFLPIHIYMYDVRSNPECQGGQPLKPFLEGDYYVIIIFFLWDCTP